MHESKQDTDKFGTAAKEIMQIQNAIAISWLNHVHFEIEYTSQTAERLFDTKASSVKTLRTKATSNKDAAIKVPLRHYIDMLEKAQDNETRQLKVLYATVRTKAINVLALAPMVTRRHYDTGYLAALLKQGVVIIFQFNPECSASRI